MSSRRTEPVTIPMRGILRLLAFERIVRSPPSLSPPRVGGRYRGGSSHAPHIAFAQGCQVRRDSPGSSTHNRATLWSTGSPASHVIAHARLGTQTFRNKGFKCYLRSVSHDPVRHGTSMAGF